QGLSRASRPPRKATSTPGSLIAVPFRLPLCLFGGLVDDVGEDVRGLGAEDRPAVDQERGGAGDPDAVALVAVPGDGPVGGVGGHVLLEPCEVLDTGCPGHGEELLRAEVARVAAARLAVRLVVESPEAVLPSGRPAGSRGLLGLGAEDGEVAPLHAQDALVDVVADQI